MVVMEVMNFPKWNEFLLFKCEFLWETFSFTHERWCGYNCIIKVEKFLELFVTCVFYLTFT